MKPYSPAHTYFKLVLLHQPQCVHSHFKQFICPLGLQAEKHNQSQQSQKTAAQCAPHQGDGHLPSSRGRPPQPPPPAASARVQQKTVGKPWDCVLQLDSPEQKSGPEGLGFCSHGNTGLLAWPTKVRPKSLESFTLFLANRRLLRLCQQSSLG